MMTENAVTLEHRPSFGLRLARFFGFRFHLGEEPENVDAMSGWMKTTTRMEFGILDRLRILVSGRLKIDLIQHTPVEVEYSRNRLDWRILPPGERF